MSTHTRFSTFPPTPGGDDGDIGRPESDSPSSKLMLEPYSPPFVVETPTSPSSAFALSRFEFETGRGNEGTKILMDDGHDWAGWEVTWDGKTDANAVPARRSTGGTDGEDGTTLRVYFLLPPGQHIPPLVSIRQRVGRVGGDTAAVLWTKPMPAIFPASSSTTTGQRGVLHTIWAQQRLADLAAEIAAEMQANSESVGLQIAIQEHAWITEHFGNSNDATPAAAAAAARSPSESEPETDTDTEAAAASFSPHPPSGNTSKLGEKLRGLRLATSPADLEAASRADLPGASKGSASTTLWTHVHATQQTRSQPQQQQQQQHTAPSHVYSLDAVLQGGRIQATDTADADGEDELFALPMSPRSPDMVKSPFSVL
ncbi:hypothetical protein CMQ_6398 [Grosmannia clavigera kw1407]|uniref:Uncharacterized protein n=1 Tax=Grosmannia clavigera (strain kw1407 / UAMH 11150) TaxID=655863 RepID=F0XMH6_GROCL|nr:uncharacterized protein CMQ_6398 [Grosmannia clavigera kw1407]EFX01456.1 hypothetical protein CMQ_6398 [Grosmannia clavigera kw1407]